MTVPFAAQNENRERKDKLFKLRNIIAAVITIAFCMIADTGGGSHGGLVAIMGYLIFVYIMIFVGLTVYRARHFDEHITDSDYLKRTERYHEEAGSGLIIMAILALNGLISLFPLIMFLKLPAIFTNARFWQVILTIAALFIFIRSSDVVHEMKKKKALYENPYVSNSDKYFSAIAADKDVSYQDSAEIGKIKASGELFSQITDDELVPHAAELKALVKKQSDCMETAEETPEAWICPTCGSENPDDFAECVFCGAVKNAYKE